MPVLEDVIDVKAKATFHALTNGAGTVRTPNGPVLSGLSNLDSLAHVLVIIFKLS